MTVSIEKLVEENISDLANRLGYTSCWLYSFNWITNFEKFISTLFKAKDLFIVLPVARDDKDTLVTTIRKIARNNNSSVIILYSEKLSANNFIVCNRISRK